MSDRKAAIREAAARPRTRKSHGLALLEDIGALTGHSQDLQETLDNIVKIVAEQMRTEVCSLYLFDPKDERLTLSATTGLERAAVGKVKMRVDEGLTGMVIEKGEPVMVVDALAHPRYKYFPETGEERYHSFLGVPIAEKRSALGVLIVQTLRRRRFSPNELRVLRAIASQVRGIIVQARLLETLETKEKERQEYRKRMVDAIRRLHAYEKDDRKDVKTKRTTDQFRLTGARRVAGLRAGARALAAARGQPRSSGGARRRAIRTPNASGSPRRSTQSIEEMIRLKEKMHVVAPEIDGAIFDAQRMMLEDASFPRKIEARIRAGLAAETALKHVVEEYVEAFLARLRRLPPRARRRRARHRPARAAQPPRSGGARARVRVPTSCWSPHELTLSDLSLMEHERLQGHRARDGRRHVARLDSRQVVRDPDRGRRRAHRRRAARGRRDDRRRQLRRRLREPRRSTSRASTSGSIASTAPSTSSSRRSATSRPRPPTAHVASSSTPTSASSATCTSRPCTAPRASASTVPSCRSSPTRTFPARRSSSSSTRRVIERMKGRPVTIRTLDVGADKYPSYPHRATGGESVSRLALDPDLARDAGDLQGAAAGDPARRRARTDAYDVPDDLQRRGDPARQGAARRGPARARRRPASRSTGRCRSAS